MGIGIRQYTEKPRGTLCTRIVYGVGVSNILPLGLPPAPKEFAKPPFKISKRMEKVKEVM